MTSADKGDAGNIQQHSLLQAFQSQIILIILALFILTFVVQPFRIPSASMEPTLLVGDFLLVDKQIPTQYLLPEASANRIRRGDLIVFHYPVNPAKDLVKRVIGLPGEQLRMHDGRVYIDNRALAESYAVYRTATADSYRDDFPRVDHTDPSVDSRWWIQMHTLVSQGELTIPAGHYFVMGDNRNDSEDSRYWGLVPKEAILGKPFLIYFSLNIPDSDTSPQESTTAEVRANRHEPSASLFHFARWERTLRILH